jgi:hypothetical protein
MDAVPDREPARDLDRHLDAVRAAPRDAAPVELIVLRPGVEQREVVAEAVLDPLEGLVGDHWKARGSRSMPDGSADPAAQLTIMSTRVLAAIEPDPTRWPLAGDQLYADLDLSTGNLPPGTRLAVGDAVVEVSFKEHTGCAKFGARFGADALRWISTPLGRALRMRGMYVCVVQSGAVRTGDAIRRL